MSDRTIFKDIERHLVRELHATLTRQVTVAKVVLDTPDIILLIQRASASMMSTCQLIAATAAKTEGETEQLLDVLEGGWLADCRRNRGRIICAAAAIRRGERPEKAL